MSFIQYCETHFSKKFVFIDEPNKRFFKVCVEEMIKSARIMLFIYNEKGVVVHSEGGFKSLDSALDAATKVIANEV